MKKHPASLCINEDGHEVIAFYPDDLRNMISDIKEAHDRRIAELEAEVAALRATKARWVPVSERLPKEKYCEYVTLFEAFEAADESDEPLILSTQSGVCLLNWKADDENPTRYWLENLPEVPT